MTESLIYLSDADVARAALSLDRLREIVAGAFAAQARGAAEAAPKSVLNIGKGHVFQAKPASLREANLTGMKWFGLVPSGQTSGPSVESLIVLSDMRTGRTLAVMGGNWITATRTAAMSAIAAQTLARPESVSIGFVGCGVQAHSHLDAMRLVLPRLTNVVAYSRTESSARRLAEAATARGMSARVTTDPQQAVEGLDVVITTVPEGGRLEFLDTAWLVPGSFTSAVDLGRSWKRETLRSVDLLATDEHEQTRAVAAMGRMAFAGPYDADLAGMTSGTAPKRTSPQQRTMFCFSGHALADIAAAQVVYETALRDGLGVKLPL